MGAREEQLMQQFQDEFKLNVYDKERCEFAQKTWITTAVRMVASLAEKFGWDAVNEQLKVYWAQRANERMKYNVARVTAKGEPRDCVTLGRMIVTNRAGSSEKDFLEITPTRLRLIRRKCGEVAVQRETGTLGKIFWPCTTIWGEAYARELNPKIKLTVLKAECQGDKYCDFLYEMKD